jgi:hypothetical protein
MATSNANNTAEGYLIPTKIIENNLLSTTSEAYKCFVEQQLCANLQAYLVNYVASVSSLYPVYS